MLSRVDRDLSFRDRQTHSRSGRAEEIVREAIAGRRDDVFLVSKVLPTNASAQGKIRSFGVSNFGVPELEEALALAGPRRIAQNQVLYHLGERTIEHEVVPFCEAHGIAVVGYTPFGRGSFPPASGRAELRALAENKGVTPHALALAFLTRRPSLFAIPKSSDARHVEENAGALSLSLSAAEIAAIDQAFPVGKRRRGVAML
jgi:diketogulonate reductase-like aldo/keto reductase